MVRCTSLAAHRDNEEKGINSIQRARIFSYILENPGCSRNDIKRYLDMEGSTVSARVNELKKSEVIKEDGCKRDPITGKSNNRLFVRELE